MSNEKNVGAMVSKIHQKYGKESFMRASDKPEVDYDSISSGSLGLDLAMGVGGYPRGRVIEIFGAESSGKTTLAIHAMAEATKKGELTGIIDAEHAFDLDYAVAVGIDPEHLMISQPSSGEEGLGILESCIASGEFAVLVVDSVAALTPKSEINGDMGDSSIGVQARLMSQALRKITAIVGKTNTLVIFINQLREKVGVVFGSPIVTTGGNALKFYSTIRLDVSRAGTVKDGDEVLANKTRVKVVKNKVAPPFKKAEFDIVYGEGISKFGEIVDLGVELEVLTKSGSYFSYGDTKLAQGRDNVVDLLRDNIELTEELETIIRGKLGMLNMD